MVQAEAKARSQLLGLEAHAVTCHGNGQGVLGVLNQAAQQGQAHELQPSGAWLDQA